MSKKLFSTEKWKRHLRARQESEDRKRRLANRRCGWPGGGAPRPALLLKLGWRTLVLPEVFSIVTHPEEVLEFLASMEHYADKYHLYLDASGVTTVTTDAIAGLIATIKRLEGTKSLGLRGNAPKDPAVANILVQSGFFEHMQKLKSIPKPTHGMIARKTSSRQVEPKLARDVIRFGSKALTGQWQRSHAAYRVLIESMNNTRNHAAKAKQRAEEWWCTVYANQGVNRVCYGFVDSGVGIFRSVRVGGFRKAYRALGLERDSAILQDLLLGKIASRTGLPFRGKGLPAINRLAESGRIKSLIIVANGVYANVSQGIFRDMKKSFHGTLLYWEVEP